METANKILDATTLTAIDAYWRAANYLSVGQIYLQANPLLKQRIELSHVKQLLLGHWGTAPGHNFIYARFNQVIKKYDLNMLYNYTPESEEEKKAKLYWFFCYYGNGMNTKDVAYLRYRNIDDGFIVFTRAKIE